jgi:hypothetical protein
LLHFLGIKTKKQSITVRYFLEIRNFNQFAIPSSLSLDYKYLKFLSTKKCINFILNNVGKVLFLLIFLKLNTNYNQDYDQLSFDTYISYSMLIEFKHTQRKQTNFQIRTQVEMKEINRNPRNRGNQEISLFSLGLDSDILHLTSHFGTKSKKL